MRFYREIYKIILLILILLFPSFWVVCQQKYAVTGHVIDSKTKVQLPFVNIFLEGTTLGTQTDINGNYTLSKIPKGKHKFVASMVGYLSYIEEINLNSNDYSIAISLVEDVKYLSEVKVTSGRDKVWERQMKIFEREFLGNDFNRKNVKIINREIINFIDENGKLSAIANQPIVIENKILGYKYTYILQNFELDRKRLAYKGLGRYELLDTTQSAVSLKYQKNRSLAYQGSIKHFILSFLNGTLSQEGFRCYYLNNDPQNLQKGSTRMPVFPQNCIFATEVPGNYLITLDCPLLVYYEKNYPNQISELKQIGNIIVDSKGDLIDPYSIQISGDMAGKRIAKTLPFDYEVNDSQHIPNRNIDISNLPTELKTSMQYTREKVNINGIETHYLAGEKIQLEVFVKDLTTQKATEISKTLYVDFIQMDNGKLLDHFIIKLDNGLADFNIKSDFQLKTGNYKIRAYTNWMRNFSESCFFETQFTVFSHNYITEYNKNNKTVSLDTVIITAEGNKLVAGIRTKVLIETKNNLGEATSVNFLLVSSAKDTLINGQTDSTGKAIFEINPIAKTSYYIMASQKQFELPKISNSGTTLTVDNYSNQEKLRAFIQNKIIENQPDTLTLAIIREGEVLFWTSFLNNKAAVILNIPKKNLFGHLTVFLVNKLGEVIAERQILIEENWENGQNFNTDNQMMAKNPTHFLKVDKKLPFWDEKGIHIKGNITKLNGKPNRKPVKVSLEITSLPTDSVKTRNQNYYLYTLDKFAFEDLVFYSKKQLTFFATDNLINIDSTNSIPVVYPEKKSINWYLLKKQETIDDLENKKNEQIEDSLKAITNDKLLLEKKLIPEEIDPFAIDGFSPNYVMDEKNIRYMLSMHDLISKIFIAPRTKIFSNIGIFLENRKLNADDFAKLNSIDPATVESIVVFEYKIPPNFAAGGIDCAIIIKEKKVDDSHNSKTSLRLIVRGYDY